MAAGDAKASDLLVKRYGGLVWSLARKLSPTDAEAEDAVQDIYLSLWQSAARFDEQVASEPTFVAMIARRRLIDRQRRRSRRPEYAVEPEQLALNRSDDDEVALPPVTGEASRAAAEAFKLLSENQQKVLRLSIYEGLSHEKIARATKMPLGTVKTHARRGLIKLRELIEQRSTPTSSA
ncbi:MAG: sigma-70 family RNA polymerase sigma factor [Planctomycetota bacterium]